MIALNSFITSLTYQLFQEDYVKYVPCFQPTNYIFILLDSIILIRNYSIIII